MKSEKAVLFAYGPDGNDSVPDHRVQISIMRNWATIVGKEVLRCFHSDGSDLSKFRDMIDSMVGFAVRRGAGTLVFFTKEVLDDDSLCLLAEVSHAFGIDVWFLGDDDGLPWNASGGSDADSEMGSDAESGSFDAEIFIIISRGGGCL